MRLRKIIIGLDFMSNAMHYLVGQRILKNTNTIHKIIKDDVGNVTIFIISDNDEVKEWKSISSTVPYVAENDINF